MLKKNFKKSLEKVFLFKKCIYICTIIINQNQNQTYDNLQLLQIDFRKKYLEHYVYW